MYKLIINHLTREKRFALLDGDAPIKLFIDQPKHHSSVGDIYLGRVEKVLPGMNAAFVDIGEGKNGYLHRDKLVAFVQRKEENLSQQITSFVHQGEKLLVQVEKDAAGTKGPRLTNIIELTGDHLIYMPEGKYIAISKKIADSRIRKKIRLFGLQLKEEQEGLIFRTSSEAESDSVIADELSNLRAEYEKILQKARSMKKPGKVLEQNAFLDELLREIKKLDSGEILTDDLSLKNLLQKHTEIPIKLYTGKENIFSAYKLDYEIEKALKRVVWLNNGAYLIFDEAEALTIIDVNTGKFSGKNDLQETVVKTNEWAAAEAARQIRLRDIAGMILIDFIDMKDDQDRKHIMDIIEAELKKDDRRTNVIGFTPLGILQLTRKKTKQAMSEALTVKCPSCDGTGRILSPETLVFRLERELWEHRGGDAEAVLIEASEDVERIFSGADKVHKKRIEEMLQLEVIFHVEKSALPYYEIRRFGNAADLMIGAKINF